MVISSTGYAQQGPVFRKWSGGGLKLEIAPLNLDQVQAFYIGRGFSPADAGFIAETGCIFRSAIGNAGTGANDPKVTVQLANWRVIVDGKATPPMTREIWAKAWAARGVDESQTIAFYWSLFPSEQLYRPSDYNWGLISFALSPGARFDLELHWSQAGEERTQVLKNLECGK